MTISKSTIVRTIMIILVVINIVLEKCGVDVIPTDEATISMCVETAVEVAVIVVGFWYNNSFSKKALKAQKYLENLRESK